jgi:hypothetical protein
MENADQQPGIRCVKENILNYYYQNKLEAKNQRFNSVDQKTYYTVKQSYEFILYLMWIEDKFSILLDNFYEFEETVFSTYGKLCKSEHKNESINLGNNEIRVLNRRFLNLVSSSRMYMDQLLHDTSTISKAAIIKELHSEMKDATHKAYDSSLSYQLLEFMRNIIQHKKLLVRGITYAKPFSNLLNECKHVPIFINVYIDDLKKEDKFNNKIKSLKELKQYQSNDINVIYHIREYVKEVSGIHTLFREKVQPELKAAVEVINSTLVSLNNSNFDEIAFIAYDDNDNEVDGVLVDRNIVKFMQDGVHDNLKYEGYFLDKIAGPFSKSITFNNATITTIQKNIT